MATIYYTWEQFDEAVERLAHAIEAEGFPIKVICGVPRGGLVLAVALSHRLNKPLATLTTLPPPDDWLVVDDISDSGKTLEKINPRLSATIHCVKVTSFVPTMYLDTKREGDWIVYPWEKEKQIKTPRVCICGHGDGDHDKSNWYRGCSKCDCEMPSWEREAMEKRKKELGM